MMGARRRDDGRLTKEDVIAGGVNPVPVMFLD
jgi:hypothetical protein